MKNTLIRLLLVTLAAAVVIGCRPTQPVYNVSNASVVASTGQNVTQNQVKQAITRAGAGLGWVMRDQAPGHIVGTLNLRQHMAMVDIKYDAKSYSITYRDSQQLNYADGQIHQNYNGWVQNLQQAINTQLNLL